MKKTTQANTETVQTTSELETLKNEINSVVNEKNQCEQLALPHTKQALQHAIKIGELLKTVKRLVPSRGYIKWINDNCGFDRVTAWKYTKLFTMRNKLGECNSIREAYIVIEIIKEEEGPELYKIQHQSQAALETQMRKNAKTKPGPPKPNEQSDFEKFQSLLCRAQDMTEKIYTKEETRKLVKCGQVVVDWCINNGGKVPIHKKPLPVVEMENETLQAA